MFDEPTTILPQTGDIERLLRILYKGTRPPLVRIFVCGCGRSVNLTRQDAQTFGWQLLPHVECPGAWRRFRMRVPRRASGF